MRRKQIDAPKIIENLVKLASIIGRLEAERDQFRRERDELAGARPNPLPVQPREGIVRQGP